MWWITGVSATIGLFGVGLAWYGARGALRREIWLGRGGDDPEPPELYSGNQTMVMGTVVALVGIAMVGGAAVLAWTKLS